MVSIMYLIETKMILFGLLSALSVNIIMHISKICDLEEGFTKTVKKRKQCDNLSLNFVRFPHLHSSKDL